MSEGWKILLFILCIIGIFITSFWAIEAIKTVSQKFKISETFIGSVFLSVGTSFPEFINSIYAGITDRRRQGLPTASIESFFNITGANIWQILFLSLAIAAIIIHRKFFHKSKESYPPEISNIFWKDSIFSWKLTIIETTILLYIFIFPSFFAHLTINGLNLTTLLFLGLWIGYTIKTYHTEPTSVKKQDARYFKTWNKPQLATISLLLWSIFGLFSCINFQITDSFPIDKTTSFGVILSLITSCPEFSVLFFLFRKREYQMAVSSFFGSSLFNLTLPFYSNLISQKNILGNPDMQTDKIVSWLGLNIIVLILFLITFNRHPKYKSQLAIFNGLIILILYVTITSLLAH